jgi:conjugal transfer mating pair stabilization protein TraN
MQPNNPQDPNNQPAVAVPPPMPPQPQQGVTAQHYSQTSATPQAVFSGGGAPGGKFRRPKARRKGLLTTLLVGSIPSLIVLGGFWYGLSSILDEAEYYNKLAAAIEQADTAELQNDLVYDAETGTIQGSDEDSSPPSESIIASRPAQVIVACPSGYSESDGTCTKRDTKSATQYSCPAGYTQNGSGSSTTCNRVVGGTTENRSATSTLSCDSGFTLSSGTCTKVISTNAVAKYTCPADFVVNANKQTECFKASTLINGTVNATCPTGGWSRSGSGASTQCKISEAARSSTSSSCPTGWDQRNSRCETGATMSIRPVTYSYECPNSSWTKVGTGASTRCQHLVSTNSPNYTCPVVKGTYRVSNSVLVWRSGENRDVIRSGSQCTYYGIKHNRYTCKSSSNYGTGYVERNGRCERTVGATNTAQPCNPNYTLMTVPGGQRCSRIIDSTRTTICTDGYSLESGQCILRTCSVGSRTGNICYTNLITNTSYSCPRGTPSQDRRTCHVTRNATLSCDNGFTQQGSGTSTKCVRSTSAETRASTVSYSCTAGNLSGNKCNTTQTGTVKNALSCETGWTLSGSQCTRTNGGRTESANPVTRQQCETGWALAGSQCERVLTSQKTEQTVCPAGWFKRTVSGVTDCILINR